MIVDIEDKVYTTKLPSGKKCHFSAYKVKDQKEFLMAKENYKEEEVKKKAAEFLFNLVQNHTKEDVSNFYTIDFDYLYFQMVKYSKGAESDISFKYSNKKIGIEELPISTTISIDDNLKLPEKMKFKKTIEDKELGLIFNVEQPKVKQMTDISSNHDNDDLIRYLVASTIQSVEKDGKVYTDFTLDMAKETVENLTEKTYNRIFSFFSNNPSIYFDKEVPIEGTDKSINLKDFNYTDFFLIF